MREPTLFGDDLAVYVSKPDISVVFDDEPAQFHALTLTACPRGFRVAMAVRSAQEARRVGQVRAGSGVSSSRGLDSMMTGLNPALTSTAMACSMASMPPSARFCGNRPQDDGRGAIRR